MSDDPKEAERNLKRLFICDDIYLDVFRLLAPVKVGLELALVSDRFDALVGTHFKSRKWTLGKLSVYSENIHKRNDNGSTEKTLPFPQNPLPNSIIGFSSVRICFINSDDIIAFFQCIGRLLVSNVCLELFINGESNWNNFATSVWPLLDVSAIIIINFGYSYDFHHFCRLISLSILCDCSNLRVITSESFLILQFPPDDTDGSSDGQALCKWLHTPRADGQPKVVKYRWGGYFPMDALTTSFLNATTSVRFIIRLRSVPSNVVPFELVNSLTREQLTCRRIQNGGNYWVIERSPIDKSGQKWAEWLKEALEDGGTNEWKLLGILLD